MPDADLGFPIEINKDDDRVPAGKTLAMTFPGLVFTEHADGTITATGVKGSYFICRGKPPNEFTAAYTPHDSLEKPSWGCGAEGVCARTEESVILWCNKMELRVQSRLSVHS